MKRFWRRLEWGFDKLIVPALLVLIVIVVADVFFTDFKYQYESYFLYADLAVLFVFVGDLSFKFKRARSWGSFLRREWLEIIAVMPFFWIFRLLENVIRLGELAQEILHLVARGGRFVRLFAALKINIARHERFRSFVEKITGVKISEKTAKFYSHPEDED